MSKIYTPPQATETEPRPPIRLDRVTSRQVSARGYDPATRTLALQFKPKKGEETTPVYHYPNWGADSHAEFLEAESVGTFFGLHIKGREFKKYPAEPLPALEA